MKSAHPSKVAASGASSQELEILLASFDPDCPYDEWVRIGAALHHETRGSPAGFTLYDAWSAKSSKYQGRADVAQKWNSFRVDAPGAVDELRALVRWLERE